MQFLPEPANDHINRPVRRIPIPLGDFPQQAVPRENLSRVCGEQCQSLEFRPGEVDEAAVGRQQGSASKIESPAVEDTHLRWLLPGRP